WDAIEEANTALPFRLVTAPARHFLNSTFTETSTSRRRERQPSVLIHPDDAASLDIETGDAVEILNERGAVVVQAEIFDGLQRGVVVAESVWPNAAHRDGAGINVLTGADPAAPAGGAAFHDNRVQVRRLG